MNDDKLKELQELLNSVVEPNGNQFFSKKWITENILGLKNRSSKRKLKIKNIFKDE